VLPPVSTQSHRHSLAAARSDPPLRVCSARPLRLLPFFLFALVPSHPQSNWLVMCFPWENKTKRGRNNTTPDEPLENISGCKLLDFLGSENATRNRKQHKNRTDGFSQETRAVARGNCGPPIRASALALAAVLAVRSACSTQPQSTQPPIMRAAVASPSRREPPHRRPGPG
jgi:hypothetical protein